MERRCCLDFEALLRQHWQELASYSFRKSRKRNETIYAAGEPADTLYWVESGRVKLSRLSPQGQEKILEICVPGDVFGELCICGIAVHDEQAVAMEPSVLVGVRTDGLLRFLQKRPAALQELFRLACSRLLQCREQIASLSFETVSRRLARQLVELSRTSESAPEVPAARTLYLTHEELAALIGSTREVVTSLMNEFRRQGLLDYTRRRILVYPERLNSLLREPDPH